MKFFLHQTITATIAFYTWPAIENRCKILDPCSNILNSLKISENWLYSDDVIIENDFLNIFY